MIRTAPVVVLVVLAACSKDDGGTDDTDVLDSDTNDTDVVDTDSGAPDPACLEASRTAVPDTSVAAGDVGASLDALIGGALDAGHDGAWVPPGGDGVVAELEVFRAGDGDTIVVVMEPNGDNGADCPDFYELSIRGNLTISTGLLSTDLDGLVVPVFADGTFGVGGTVTWEAIQAGGDAIAPSDFDPADYDTTVLDWSVSGPVQGAWEGTMQWSGSGGVDDTDGVSSGIIEPAGTLSFPAP